MGKEKYIERIEDEREDRGRSSHAELRLLAAEKFKLLHFTILPSIDEEDRRESILEKLEERFIERDEVHYLYYQVEEKEREEEVFCCYSLEDKLTEKIAEQIHFLIPSILLGFCLNSEENYLLVDYGNEKVYLVFYQEGRMVDYLVEALDYPVLDYIKTKSRDAFCIFLGRYSKRELEEISKEVNVLALEDAEIREPGKEIDLFRHARKKGSYYILLKWIPPYLSLGVLLLSIFSGFFLQYLLEKGKTEHFLEVKAREEMEGDCFHLEEALRKLREEEEERKQMQEVEKPKFRKLSLALRKIIDYSYSVKLLAIEYAEDGCFRLLFLCDSLEAYLEYTQHLMRQGFFFENQESLEREGRHYKIEIELSEEEDDE